MDRIDLAHHLGAVARSVGTREIDGKTTYVVVATRTYRASPAEVWDALTDAERIPRWFAPVTGDLRLGGRFQVQGNAGGEILRCEPPVRIGLTWEMGSDVSWVDVTLEVEGEGTRLVLEHAAAPSPFWDQFGPGAVGVGWELGLLGLALHLDTGANVPPEATAWAESDEGKAFARGAAAGWGDASVRFGTPEADARAAASRTADFYTGVAPPSEG